MYECGVSWSDEENPARLCKSAHGAASIFRCENKSLDHARRVALRQLEIDSAEFAGKNVRISRHTWCGMLSTSRHLFRFRRKKIARSFIEVVRWKRSAHIIYRLVLYRREFLLKSSRSAIAMTLRSQTTDVEWYLYKFRFVFASKIRCRNGLGDRVSPRNLEQQQRAPPSRTRDRTLEE